MKKSEKDRDAFYDRLHEQLNEQPKLSKEQKVIRKAIAHIEAAGHTQEQLEISCHLNYALGLLEALIMQDDKKGR